MRILWLYIKGPLTTEDSRDYREALKVLRQQSLLIKDCGWKIVFDKSKSLFSVCFHQFISFLLCLPRTNVYTPFPFNHDWWSERKCLVEKIWSRINSLMFDWNSLHRTFLLIKSHRNLFIFLALHTKLDFLRDQIPTEQRIELIFLILNNN